jgi:hypothetical protein
MSKPTDIDALKIVIAEDGTASLTGINYGDLRSVLTAASLYRYQDEFKPRPAVGALAEEIHASNMINARWHLDGRLLLDVLHAQMAEAIRPGYDDGLPAIDRAKRSHRAHLETLERDVRKAEAAAQAKPAAPPDPLREITATLRTVVRQADGVLAQLERFASDQACGEGRS